MTKRFLGLLLATFVLATAHRAQAQQATRIPVIARLGASAASAEAARVAKP